MSKATKKVRRIVNCTTTQACLDLLGNHRGKLFYVKYYKENGAIREAQGRFSVTKDISGKGAKYNFLEHGVLGYFETKPLKDSKGVIRGNDCFRRSFKGERLIEAHFSGKEVVCTNTIKPLT